MTLSLVHASELEKLPAELRTQIIAQARSVDDARHLIGHDYSPAWSHTQRTGAVYAAACALEWLLEITDGYYHQPNTSLKTSFMLRLIISI